MAKRKCSIDGCERNSRVRTWCRTHYDHWRLYGHPLAGVFKAADDEERFWRKVTKTPTCWIWNASRCSSGYGTFFTLGKTYASHRFSFELANGTIPDGVEIDHTCHNPACVNPGHLRLATHKQNCENRSGPDRDNKTGVRGVYYNKDTGRWVANVKHNQRLIYCGAFDTVAEAESAAVAKRMELFTHNLVDRLEGAR